MATPVGPPFIIGKRTVLAQLTGKDVCTLPGPPNRMVRSLQTPVCRELIVVLVFLIEAGISGSVPELLYLRVLTNISKVTNSRLIRESISTLKANQNDETR